MTGCRVRLAKTEDVDVLVELSAEHASFERARYDAAGKATKLNCALFGPTPRLMAWVALLGDRAVGYSTVTEEFSTWDAAAFLHMDCLFVQPGHRNQGIGDMLLNVVTQFARERGFSEVQWQTPAWNGDARRFYRRHCGIEHEKIRYRLPIE